MDDATLSQLGHGLGGTLELKCTRKSDEIFNDIYSQFSVYQLNSNKIWTQVKNLRLYGYNNSFAFLLDIFFLSVSSYLKKF